MYQFSVCHCKPQLLPTANTRQSFRCESCPRLVSFCHLPLDMMDIVLLIIFSHTKLP